jgi:predicted glycosyltransferase
MMRSGDKLASYRVLGAALARLLGRPWRLAVIGDGPARAEVEAALAPVADRVDWCGAAREEEIPSLLRAADLCLWPAVNEAYGLALLEAQAAGIPVVAGRTGGVGDVVADGESGVLVPVGDAGAFAAAVAALLDDPARRRAMTKAARRRILAGARHRPGRRPARRDPQGDRVKLLFHVQHLLGIGHVKRAAALVRAFRRAGMDVTVLAGGDPVPGIAFDAPLVQLPPVRATDASFRSLVGPDGAPFDAALAARRQALVAAALAHAAPDVVLVESFPFGRRAFRRELMPLLESGVPVAVSLRDIAVAKDPARTAEAAALVRHHVAAVLVHGDPAFVRLEESFPAAAEIADRVHYTGYVYEPPPPAAVPEGEVVVSAGGGAVGAGLLRAALAARPMTRHRGRPWRLITGPNLARSELAGLGGDGVVIERFRGDFPRLLRACTVSVSQAGYNTVLDLLWARPPCVLVPFAAPGETEQTLRAARLGCGVVAEAALTPGRLAAAIDAALPPAVAVALDGAERSAALLNHMFNRQV